MAQRPELYDAVGVDPFTAVGALRATVLLAGVPGLGVRPEHWPLRCPPVERYVDGFGWLEKPGGTGRLTHPGELGVAFGMKTSVCPGADRMTGPDDPSELPPVATLSREQQRGTHCVWCSAALSVRTAVNLSARETDAFGNTIQWFPRCCINCRDGHPG
ncbi:hypothetical protein [Streptomyces sp. NPDC058240]|uniref:hypothetical protein n=1 Tax=Streptomyces sp. NPDC058240 TaxID=3346396 RepID=UPI0036EA4EA9